MNHHERLFLLRLDELEQAAASTDELTILSASLPLRQLLFDGSPLVDRINRPHQARLQYSVCERPTGLPDSLPRPEAYFAFGLFPDAASNKRTVTEKRRDQFLSTVVGRVDELDYTFKDVLDFVAYVLGGIHADEPKGEKQKALAALQAHPLLREAPYRYVLEASLITLRALHPLRDRLYRLSAFEKKPAAGFHGVFAIHQQAQLPAILVSCGTAPSTGQAALVIDAQGVLGLDLHWAHVRCSLRAGLVPFSTPIQVGWQIVSDESRTLVALDVGEVRYLRVFDGALALDWRHSVETLVVGADRDGEQGSDIDMRWLATLGHGLASEERIQLQTYARHDLAEAGAFVQFRGGQHLRVGAPPLG